MANSGDVKDVTLTLNNGSELALSSLPTGPVLFVNVASHCGFTPQYTALQALHEKYAARGLTVIGLPTNQFKQELGTDAAVAEFCQLNYGVTFPITTLTWVNGSKRSDLFKKLVKAKDSLGLAGPVMWNFEKFLWLPDGSLHRFRSVTTPDDSKIVELIEANLA
jgi:glutathione peroxidase